MARRKGLSGFERGSTVGARTTGASVTNTDQLAGVSTGTATEVTSAFRSVGKASGNRARSMSVMLVR